MAGIAPLTTPQLGTFRILGLRSNVASVEVLGNALASQYDSIRLAALQTLVTRGGESEMATILKGIDHCKELELPLLSSQIPQLLVPIEAGLADRDPMCRQRALCAIAKLQIASQFHHLVRVAQSAQDPQQIVATQLVLSLACLLGNNARLSLDTKSELIREQLLNDLWRSMSQFEEHRITQVFDAWLCASHWDDEQFKDLFNPSRRDIVSKMVQRQLKNSRRPELIELTVGILWSKGPFYRAIELVGERNDPDSAIQIASMINALGLTSNLNKNMREKVPIRALDSFDFSDSSNSIVHRGSLLRLMTIADVTPDRLLAAINDLLAANQPETENECANAIRNLRSLSCEIIVMVLSDSDELTDASSCESPPWKAKLRTELERLFKIYPFQPSAVQKSIEFAFSDFQCEELSKHLDDWTESHLTAFGKMVRIAQRGYVTFLEREAQSPSAVKRARAIRMVRILGIDDNLRAIVVESLKDKSESVRTEAVYSIASSLNRLTAIELLTPLVEDEDNGVKVAVNLVLSQLKGQPI